MAWILRLVDTGAEGEGPCPAVMEINRRGDLVDLANLGLALAQAKRLLGAFNGRSSPRRPRSTPFGGRNARAVTAFAV